MAADDRNGGQAKPGRGQEAGLGCADGQPVPGGETGAGVWESSESCPEVEGIGVGDHSRAGAAGVWVGMCLCGLLNIPCRLDKPLKGLTLISVGRSMLDGPPGGRKHRVG